MPATQRDLSYQLNRLANTLVNGRPTLADAAAANKWAGTSGLGVQGALNKKAGRTDPKTFLSMRAVCNALGGTTDQDEATALASASASGGSSVTVSAGTTYASTAAVSSAPIPLPAGLQAGDWTFLFCSLSAASGVITPPAGWTPVLASAQSTASTSHAAAIFARKWQSGDTNPTVTCTSGRLAVVPVRISGANATQAWEAVDSLSPAASASVSAPSITVTNGRTLLASFHGRESTVSLAVTWTPPADMTEVGDVSTAVAAASNAHVSVAYAPVSAGASGARTATASDVVEGARGVAISLVPAA